jgi:hypothetical protein
VLLCRVPSLSVDRNARSRGRGGRGSSVLGPSSEAQEERYQRPRPLSQRPPDARGPSAAPRGPRCTGVIEAQRQQPGRVQPAPQFEMLIFEPLKCRARYAG